MSNEIAAAQIFQIICFSIDICKTLYPTYIKPKQIRVEIRAGKQGFFIMGNFDSSKIKKKCDTQMLSIAFFLWICRPYRGCF